MSSMVAGDRYIYFCVCFCVVARFLCPIQRMICTAFLPALAKREAHVWRKVCTGVVEVPVIRF